MLPINDINPTRRFPFLTFLLIGINVAVFVWQMTMTPTELQEMFVTLSVVPRDVNNDPYSLETFLDIVRSMFFHGGIAHIGGNMLYLYLFGDNVEDRLGRVVFVLLYFVSGFVAAIAQVLVDPQSTVPLVGASGAIAGVLGSYLVLYPGVKVQGIVPIGYFAWLAEWPAYIVLFLWFGLQLFNGVAALSVPTTAGGGVAFFAHVGGFVCGAVLTFFLAMIIPQPPAEERRNMLYERAKMYRW